MAQAVKRGLSAGEKLPQPWPLFDQKEIAFRRSDLHVIAGPPGSMKTTFMLNIVNLMGPKVPTLYHSSDSNDFTVAARVLSMRSGMPVSEAGEVVRTAPHGATSALNEFNHVKWSFDAGPTLERLYREAEAFREVHGEYPHHTVIDILSDIDSEGVTEYNYSGLMSDLKVMARDMESAFTLLHHTSESAKAGSPPPSSALMGKIAKLPALVLTLWGDSYAGTLDVAVVKNRFGPSDSTASKFFRMTAKPDVCKIEEQPVQDTSDILFRDGPKVPWDEKIGVDYV